MTEVFTPVVPDPFHQLLSHLNGRELSCQSALLNCTRSFEEPCDIDSYKPLISGPPHIPIVQVAYTCFARLMSGFDIGRLSTVSAKLWDAYHSNSRCGQVWGRFADMSEFMKMTPVESLGGDSHSQLFCNAYMRAPFIEQHSCVRLPTGPQASLPRP